MTHWTGELDYDSVHYLYGYFYSASMSIMFVMSKASIIRAVYTFLSHFRIYSLDRS